MYLTDLDESDFNEILNMHFKSDISYIESVLLSFKLKLYRQVIGIAEHDESIDFSMIK